MAPASLHVTVLPGVLLLTATVTVQVAGKQIAHLELSSTVSTNLPSHYSNNGWTKAKIICN